VVNGSARSIAGLPQGSDRIPRPHQFVTPLQRDGHGRQRRGCSAGIDRTQRGTPDRAAALMKPYAGAIDAWEVGAEVGNVKNNRPELMERTAHGGQPVEHNCNKRGRRAPP